MNINIDHNNDNKIELEKTKCGSINTQKFCDKNYNCAWDTEEKKCQYPWTEGISKPIEIPINEDKNVVKMIEGWIILFVIIVYLIMFFFPE